MQSTGVQIFRALSESLVYELDDKASQKVKELCANFIIREFDKMTFIYKNALMLISIYFNFAPIFKQKNTFINIPIRKRLAVIKKWQNSKLYFKRDFIKLILTLTLLAYYDSEVVTDRLGIDRKVYLQILSFYNGVS